MRLTRARRPRRREGCRRGHQPQVGATDPAVVEQGEDDPVGRGVHGDGQAETDARDGRVDADDAAVRVGQRTTGVARVEQGVGLDHVLDQPGRRTAAGGDAAAERADDAGGHAAGQPERVADGDDQLTDAQPVGVAVLRWRRGTARSARSTARSDSGSRPTTSKRAVVPSANAASPEDASPTTCALVTRWPSAVSTTPEPGRLAAAAADAQRGHARRQGLGHPDHDRRVRVQRLARDLLHVGSNARAGGPRFRVRRGRNDGPPLLG